MRRMDRYKDETQNRVNRLEKNQDLYQDIVNNPKVTNITDVTNANAYELNANRENQSARETYQQRMKYQGVGEVPKVKKELEDFNYLYPKKEKKIYDINSVLEEARKNRQEKDALEEKRKLKYTSYNILAGVNLEELAKYREEKKNRAKTPEEEEIHDLMDTIASKTLAGEISKEETVELLSDLMATSILDKVAPIDEVGEEEETKEPEIISTETIMVAGTTELPKAEEKEDKEENKEYQPEEKLDVKQLEEKMDEQPITNTKSLDKDFYTKSMDLSTHDLELEMADDFKEKGLPIGVKILIVLLILSIIAVTIYFVYLRLK